MLWRSRSKTSQRHGCTREWVSAASARDAAVGARVSDSATSLQACQREHQLFEHLFPGGDPSGSALAPLIDSLATMLYDTLRPAFIQLQDLAALCQLVHILQQEVPPSSRQDVCKMAANAKASTAAAKKAPFRKRRIRSRSPECGHNPGRRDPDSSRDVTVNVRVVLSIAR